MFFSTSLEDEKNLLAQAGAARFEDLIADLPAARLNPSLGLENGLAESDIFRRLDRLGAKNKNILSFLGAGAYDHHIPAAVSALAGRSEFATAYTPYQPEASQGTLQTIFEFQSLVAEITGMEVANASLYDGATALVEAALLAFRHTGRDTLILPANIHPHHRKTMETYLGVQNAYRVVEAPCPNGIVDITGLEELLAQNTGRVAAVAVQSPNFFGVIEDAAALAPLARAAGALFIVSANPLALGVIAPPGEVGADIAVGDGQPLAAPLSFGGPYVGLFACRAELTRKMPGRLCGQTRDAEGRTGYVLTLQAREQHIRREKANSNICTNQNLVATAFAIHAALLGPEGLRELAEENLHRAHAAAEELTRIPGVRMAFPHPFFNEFVLALPVPAERLAEQMAEDGIMPGLPLGRFFPGMENHLLVCVTEKCAAEDVAALAAGMRRHL